MTVGDALDVTEQSAAVALAADDSVVLALVATMAEDSGVPPGDADTVYALFELNLRAGEPGDLRRQGRRARDWPRRVGASGAITQSQLDQLVGAFRSVGQVIADVLAFAFPRLEEYRIDLNADPEKFVLITGSDTAVLSANPDEVLSCTSLKQSDQLELELAADSFEIDEDADFRFYKVRSGGTREKHEMVMRAIGTLRLEGVRIKLELDDDLEPPGAVIDLADPADRAEAVAIVPASRTSPRAREPSRRSTSSASRPGRSACCAPRTCCGRRGWSAGARCAPPRPSWSQA